MMSDEQNPAPNPARLIALAIIFVMMVGVGLSLPLTLSGDFSTAALICGGSLVFAVLVWLVGGFLVAAIRKNDDLES